MRLTADARRLAAPVRVAFAVANGRANPVLGHVRCEAAGEAITLCGSNLETAVRLRIPAEVGAPGVVLLPPEFAEIVRGAAGGLTVEVRAQGGQQAVVVVTADGAEYALAHADPAAHPGMPDMPDGGAAFDAESIAAAVGQVIHAVATDERKYAQKCVCWDVGDETLTLVATDGKRLAVAGAGPVAGPAAGQYLVPPAAMKLLAGLAGAVTVSLSPNAFFARDAGTTIYSRLVEGRFPPWRSVLPRGNGSTVVGMDLGAFAGAVRRASIVADAEANRVVCEFGPDGVRLRAASQVRGASVVPFRPTAFQGDPVTIQFRPEYLTDLERLGAADLHLYGPEKAAVWRCAGSVQLVVPLV